MLDLCCSCEIRPAAIFHDDGDYCLQCWNERTHPQVLETDYKNKCAGVVPPLNTFFSWEMYNRPLSSQS